MEQQLIPDIIYASANPQALVLQMSADHERETIAPELKHLQTFTSVPFVLCRVEVSDWNAGLSPWQAPPAFGKENFAGKAACTLAQLKENILPRLQAQYGTLPVCLAGYSLAGLFALWAATQTNLFSRIAAASPSVWFPGWIAFAEQHPLQAQALYLSLGDREDRSRIPMLREVKNCIIRQNELAGNQGISHILEWNEGTHFNHPDRRTARAIAWCLNEGTEQTTDKQNNYDQTGTIHPCHSAD